MRIALASASMSSVGQILRRPALLLPVPILTVAVLWAGSQPWVVVGLIAAQLGWLVFGLRPPAPVPQAKGSGAGYPRIADIATLESLLALDDMDEGAGPHGAALVVRLDDADDITNRHGCRYSDALAHELGRRLGQSLREQDAYCRMEPAGYGIALFPQRHLELSAVLAVAQRLQSHLGQSFSFESVTVWPSISIGFCLSPRAARLNGIGMLDAAAQAAERAWRAGPAGLYSYSAVDLPSRLSGEHQNQLRQALETGAICAHFQPQICTRTGQISGLEALARWEHPDDGLMPPSRFLPWIEAAGLSSKLAERMLRDSLAMLKRLDALGFTVPSVAINLSGPELRNPHLADDIAWELDSHDLPAARLVVEILETVVADSDDDIMVRNIARLAGMGCGIDLDDFGTGNAALANIRRFAVARLKIDRSFITHLNEDRERQRMMSAILSMAEQLELGTVAEGVETEAELALVAQLGCGHAQGFAIARPMPGTELPRWLRTVAPVARPAAVASNDSSVENVSETLTVSATRQAASLNPPGQGAFVPSSTKG